MKLISPESEWEPVYRVTCPTCGMEPGWTCITRGFGGDCTAHQARRDLAGDPLIKPLPLPMKPEACPQCDSGDVTAAYRLPPGAWKCQTCGAIWRTKAATPAEPLPGHMPEGTLEPMAKPRRSPPAAKAPSAKAPSAKRSRSGTPGAGRERRTYADRKDWPTISITMPAETREQLRELAERLGVSGAELVREGIALVAKKHAAK